MAHIPGQPLENEWVEFPGGELEGKRPKVLCPACRALLARAAAAGGQAGAAARAGAARPLCFQCYRADLDREKALKAAGELDTASVPRFQDALPFEPVNRPRLEMLKADRTAARAADHAGAGQYATRRRQAQIAARHALQAIAAGLTARAVAHSQHARVMAMAIHAAELQFPEAWLPFVIAQ